MRLMTPSTEARSGHHWWPTGTGAIGAAGDGHVTPSGDVRTKTFAWPFGSSWLHATWTPLRSAVTTGKLEKFGKLKPLAHANVPSPQLPTAPPLPPVNWPPSNDVKRATS